MCQTRKKTWQIDMRHETNRLTDICGLYRRYTAYNRDHRKILSVAKPIVLVVATVN